MFREMRRNVQMLSSEESISILKSATSGVLSLIGDNGYPYGVPLSHVYHNGNLYFHSALSGHKIDAINATGKASFTVIEKDDVLQEKFTTCYRSVIAFGKVRTITDIDEINRLIRLMTERFCPNQPAEATEKEIAGGLHRMCIIEMDIEHLTGKQAKELVKIKREQK